MKRTLYRLLISYSPAGRIDWIQRVGTLQGWEKMRGGGGGGGPAAPNSHLPRGHSAALLSGHPPRK